jgi:hypothetical protein
MADRGKIEKRIIKVPMTADLIRRMDEALTAGRGGLETREQFLREAAEGLLTELSYPEAPPEPAKGKPAESTDIAGSAAPTYLVGTLESVPAWEQEELRLADLVGSAIGPISAGFTLADGVARPSGEPLLGLHNRDFPSLWAAWRLARYSEDQPITVVEFWRRVTAAAWFYGEQLTNFEHSAGTLRLTPIFPTNPSKRGAAEQGFQVFALGEIPRRPPEQGEIPVGGPLFDWRICQLERRDGALLIGLTPAGRRLLEQMAGVSLELPHRQAEAEAFLGHLYAIAGGERWGFERTLAIVAEEPSREELVATIAEERADWTAATASSVAQGYVARAREWGLLEPRLQEGRYRLTRFGEEWQREPSLQTTADNGEVRE